MNRAAFLGFGWLRPEALAWSVAGLLVLLLGVWAVRARARAIAGIVAPRQRRRFVPQLSLNRARARYAFAALALMLLAVSLAGPVRGFTLREVRRRGLDLVVCIDTSRSMLVRDLRPDRITRARREVRGLLDRLRGDRVALIAFAGDAREIAPLTHDRTALASLLETVTPAENEKGGTDLGAALERALAMFDGRTGAHEAIVLLTDGEDLEGRGLALAAKAAERGVKVFVVGMGTEAGGKIPLERPGGGETFLRDAQNQEVVSSMRGRGLEELAATTGGAYLSADASAAPLEELYDKRVSRLEARELQGGQEFVPHDRFQWFLGLAGACMSVAAGLRERRRRPTQRRAKQSAGHSLQGAGAHDGAPLRPTWARALAPWLLAPLLQSPQLPTPAPVAPPPAEPAVVEAPAPIAPYAGSARRGLIELREALASEDLERAHALGASLDAMPGLDERSRARIEYHRGIVAQRRGELADAAGAFARAGGLAEAGRLRLDAWYNAGTVELGAAEQLFFAIPEAREAHGLPALPAAPGAAPGLPPPGPGEKNQDLDRATAAYQIAKQSLLLRLRADWHDADPRANLELIQRRLSELAKIREQRKQEEQQKKEQQQDPNQKQDPKDEPKDSKPADPDEKPPEDGKTKEPQDGQDQPEKSEDPKPEPPKDEQQPSEEQKPEDAKPAEPSKPEGEPRELSKEEISRLMDQLANIEREARELQARMRARRRVPVEKDW